MLAKMIQTDGIFYVRKKQVLPRGKLKRKTKKLNDKQKMESKTDRQADFDRDLIDLQIIIDVPIISNRIEERITNHTIKNLSADNNQFYIEHEKRTNTFTLCVDPDQKKKETLSVPFRNV